MLFIRFRKILTAVIKIKIKSTNQSLSEFFLPKIFIQHVFDTGLTVVVLHL
jgi:hypothetical protein